MATFLQIAFYLAFAGLMVVLGFGLFNLTRTDANQASRSNKLMRMRVIAQAIVIVILILMGIVYGSIKLF
ncbi:MAG: twin transmembrane helix small protein [Alphaproteobacteria bacterium]|nr:twin transmembrane helix small protein [Alphaproteobacteria bacterium]